MNISDLDLESAFRIRSIKIIYKIQESKSNFCFFVGQWLVVSVKVRHASGQKTMTKSISAPLDRNRKATRQLQSHWIRNKHQSLTNSNENTIFYDSHAKYRLLHIMRKQQKNSSKRKFLSIVKMQPIENLLELFLLCLVKNTLVISPPSTGRSRSSHLSLSLTRDLCMTFYL